MKASLVMSPREITQNQILSFLESNEKYFDAPYGILSGLTNVGKGKVREITFGVSRYLDASIQIWQANKIVVRCQGGLSYKFEGHFKSADELIEHFKKEIK